MTVKMGFRRCTLVLLALALLPGTARPQDVEVRAFLNAPQVGVGRQFVLNVEVTGTQQLDAEPVLPEMEAFARYLSAGTSTSMQIVNGRTSVSVTYQYRFLALTEGSFEIGAVAVSAGGRTLETDPLTLVVSDTPPPAGADTGDPAEGIAPKTSSSRRRFRAQAPSRTSR